MNAPSALSKTLLARNTILSFVGQVFPLTVGFLSIPYVVENLGPDRFGLLSLLWSLLGYFAVFDVGLGRATTKFVSEELGRGSPEQLPKVVWTAVIIQSLFGVCGTVIVLAILPTLMEHVFTIPAYLHEEAQRIFFLFPFIIPVILVSGSFRGVLEASQRFDAVNAVRVLFGSLNFLIPALGVAAGLDLVGIVILLMVGTVGAFVALLLINLRLTPQLRKVALESSLMKKLFSFGGWVMVSSIAAPLLTYLERFVIASFLSVGLLTYYAVPYEMISRLVILPASFAGTLFPAFSYFGAENQARVQQLIARPVKYLFISLGPVILVFTVYAGEILSLWLGEEFARQGKIVFQILTVMFLFHAFAYIPFSAVHGFGRPDLKAKFDLTMLFVFAGLCVWLVPAYGIVGAAIAKSIITVTDFLFLSLTVKRLSKLTVKDMLGDRFERGVFAVIFFAVATLIIEELSPTLLVDGIGLFFVSVLYILLLLRYIMDASDKELVRNAIMRWRVRANET